MLGVAHQQDHLPATPTGVERAVRLSDRLGADHGVDDRPQRAGLDGYAQPVERLPLRPHEDPVQPQVAVDRLLEVARRLDEAATRTPFIRASCTNKRPTPPLAACTSTASSSSSASRSRSWSAVDPVRGMAAASTTSSAAGRGAIQRASTSTYSA